MNRIQLNLKNTNTGKPANLLVKINGETYFNNIAQDELNLDYDLEACENLEFEIIKTGKTKDIVDANGVQSTLIDSIKVNGIDIKVEEFGTFHTCDNPYLDADSIQTNQLALNGTWKLKLPQFKMIGKPGKDYYPKITNSNYVDCDIACFGCSFTYGVGLDKMEDAWPGQLAKITGRDVKNFGAGGSDIAQILSRCQHFLENYKCNLALILLPHTLRKNGFDMGHPDLKELILHGYEHTMAILVGQLDSFIKKQNTKILFGAWIKQEDKLYKTTQVSKHLLPFLDFEQYPPCKDGMHPCIDWHMDFAKMVHQEIK